MLHNHNTLLDADITTIRTSLYDRLVTVL